MKALIYSALMILAVGCGQAPKDEPATLPASLAPQASAHCGQAILEIPFPRPTALIMTAHGQVPLQNGVHTFGDCSFEVRAGRVYDLN